MSSKPSFKSLPLRKDGPPGNAWGLFGDNDECGMLNLLTPEIIVKAASEIRDGVRVSTDWPLNRMSRPCFGRAPFKHEITTKTPRAVNDDTLTFNTQSSSQWDGFRHYAYQKEKLWFNGKSLDELLSSDVNGIQAWVDRGGIVGRGVLLDYASWADKNNITLTPFETKSITVSTLKEVAESQGTTFQQGDILFIRTGWVRAYDKLSDDECKTLADYKVPPAHGIESSEDTLRWLWEQDFAAVAGDQPSMEAWPCQNTDYFLHEWLLAGWGMPCHRHPLPNRFLFLLRVMTAATTVPAAERITRPLRRLAVSSTTTCAVPAKAYGTCMVANYQDARKDMCAAEFVAFKNCVQAAMKRKW